MTCGIRGNCLSVCSTVRRAVQKDFCVPHNAFFLLASFLPYPTKSTLIETVERASSYLQSNDVRPHPLRPFATLSDPEEQTATIMDWHYHRLETKGDAGTCIGVNAV